jgi:hypothetical protein
MPNPYKTAIVVSRAVLALLAACTAPNDSPLNGDEPLGAKARARTSATRASEGSGRAIVSEQEGRPVASTAQPEPQESGAAADVSPPTSPQSASETEIAAASGAETVTTEALQLTWEEFKQQAARTDADGDVYYVVEWDLPLPTEDELRAYYDAMMAGVEEKGVLHRVPGTTTDDVWTRDDALRLRYCVDTNTSTGFGAPSSGVTPATIIAAMQQATFAWRSVANVSFEYHPANNNNCGLNSPVPDNRYFKVARNEALGSPCAFGPLSAAQWTCGMDGRTIGVNTDYLPFPGQPNFNWPGIMMHELGHVLGLHHEQLHSVGGGCFFGGDVRNVSPTADLNSIMGYPLGSGGCALTTPNLSALSEGDGWTVRQLYGMPAAWYTALM